MLTTRKSHRAMLTTAKLLVERHSLRAAIVRTRATTVWRSAASAVATELNSGQSKVPTIAQQKFRLSLTSIPFQLARFSGSRHLLYPTCISSAASVAHSSRCAAHRLVSACNDVQLQHTSSKSTLTAIQAERETIGGGTTFADTAKSRCFGAKIQSRLSWQNGTVRVIHENTTTATDPSQAQLPTNRVSVVCSSTSQSRFHSTLFGIAPSHSVSCITSAGSAVSSSQQQIRGICDLCHPQRVSFVSAFRHFSTYSPRSPLFEMDSCTVVGQAKKRQSSQNNPEVDNAIPTRDLMALAHTQSKLLKSSPAQVGSSSGTFRIIVEGNIGSGKTTFLNIFSKNCINLLDKPLIVPEPIDLWRDVGGENVFQLLGDDPKRWSFAFQSYVQLTMMKIHEMVPKEGNVKVMERSLYSARYCFVENLRNKGLLTSMEYHILDQWFQFAVQSESTAVDLIIYLRSDPDIVYKRIKARGRPEESGLTLDYLRALHELHEDWLVRGKFPLRARVLSIDANTPLDQITSVYEEKTEAVLREHIAVMAQ